MSDNKPPKVVHHPGEFQINPDDYKTGNMFVDGAEKAIVKEVNDFDGINHNGVSDVAEFGPDILAMIPVLQAAAPILQELAPELNAEGIKAWIMSHSGDFFHNVENVEKKLESLEPELEKLAGAFTGLAAKIGKAV